MTLRSFYNSMFHQIYKALLRLDNKSVFGPGNGLALNRQWSIVWINDGPVLWCVYASPSFKGLTHWGRDEIDTVFADDSFKCISLNQNVWISIKIPLKFVPKGSINNIPALVQIMAWRRPGDKPLSEAMVVRLPMQICVSRLQWVNWSWPSDAIWWHKYEPSLLR